MLGAVFFVFCSGLVVALRVGAGGIPKTRFAQVFVLPPGVC